MIKTKRKVKKRIKTDDYYKKWVKDLEKKLNLITINYEQ